MPRPRSRVLAAASTAIIALLVTIVVYQRQPRSTTRLRISAPVAIPPFANVRAPARVNVVITSAGNRVDEMGDAGKMVRDILERDFSMGDWLRVVPADSSAIAVVVQATLTVRGVEVTLRDGALGTPLRGGVFPLPAVALADSALVADSLARDLAAKDAVSAALLRYNAHLADSLHRLQRRSERRTVPLFWWPPLQQREVRSAASRDSLLRVLWHADEDIRVRAERDTAIRDSVRDVLWQHVTLQRDSLMRDWRWAVHGVADQVTAWIAGHRGIAQTRIAYVTGGRLHVIDADGTNDRVVTHDGTAMSPAWRHDGRAIVYSSLDDGGTQIAQLDLRTGAVSFPPAIPRGLNITPVYSPDDRWIVFAHGADRGTELVAIPRAGGPARHIIGGGYDNSGPVFDPGGRRIAFSSARSRTPQIYSINLDGTDERLETPMASHGRSYRSSPDWSADGRAIAFEQQNGNFQVWMLDMINHTLHQLTTTGENEDPSWAPDGRHLVFSTTRRGSKNLWILDLASGRVRQLTTTGNARLAAWSPAMP